MANAIATGLIVLNDYVMSRKEEAANAATDDYEEETE
jgi:hypothetical protein